ncbi:hypothetical protein PSH79_09020 [Pseudomonas sp. FP2196]|uniref:hypothetical protein n=1 Tax=Pseudomonas sp. FP2196 TaxID=2954086 RepID=UPI00273578EE|nr:hypothetical protein [Pseudomonas sp. FP2196]WLH37427.1 hypothetical protein PSH79_09020 [Pseudomonas sp. FP2196]
MKPIEIQIKTAQGLEAALIECDRRNRALTFTRKDGLKKTYTSYDMFDCFGALRSEFPGVTFLCKGSKINVHPSGMSSQMSCGLVAYELSEGRPTEEEDIVRIFDYEDKDLTNNIEDQKAFYRSWLKSF